MPAALVIGSSAGIGLAISQRLLAAGWSVAGIARRPAPIDDARYAHHGGDVRAAGYRELVAAACDRLGALDACIFCAGVGHVLDLADLSGEAAVFEVNLLAAVATVEVVLPRMLAAGRGHFIGLSSLADRLIDRSAPSYAASKAGMSSYLEGLALACRPRGVHVSNVRFGFVDTEMSREVGPRPFLISADRAARVIERCLRRRPIRISFPRRMALLMWLVRLGPRFRVWIS